MENKEEYCNNCKWLQDRTVGEWLGKSGRCGLYGYNLAYTSLGYKRLNRCKSAERLNEYNKIGRNK